MTGAAIKGPNKRKNNYLSAAVKKFPTALRSLWGSLAVGSPLGETNMIDASQPLAGKNGLVLGIANEHSIAFGCAKAFRALGAELAITYVNEKTKTYVEPLARDLMAPIVLPCDVCQPGQLEAVFQTIGQTWGGTRFCAPLDRVCAKGGSARPSSRQFTGRIPGGHGRLMPLVHPHGAIGRAFDAQWWRAFRDELLRRREGHRALQLNGTCEGRIGKRSALSRLRAWSKGDTGSRDLGRTNKNARCIWTRSF